MMSAFCVNYILILTTYTIIIIAIIWSKIKLRENTAHIDLTRKEFMHVEFIIKSLGEILYM